MHQLHITNLRGESWLRFALEIPEIALDGGTILLDATGEITFQHTPAVEAMVSGGLAGLVTLTRDEDDAILFEGSYHLTLLTLEPNHITLRMQP